MQLAPELIADLAHRAARPDFDRLQAQLRSSGYCARPVRLQGRIETCDGHGRRRGPATRATWRTISVRVGAVGAWTRSTCPMPRAWCASCARPGWRMDHLGYLPGGESRVQFARRHCSWRGDNPFAELEASERPKVSAMPARRIYVGGELAQVLAAASEPWRTLFRLASVVGGRESELLGLWWEDVDLGDLDRATIRFGFQVGPDGKRVPLKTEESKRFFLSPARRP